jgi:hypothetical protein
MASLRPVVSTLLFLMLTMPGFQVIWQQWSVHGQSILM